MAKKASSFANDLMEAMEQAAAHASGLAVGGIVEHHVAVETIDAKSIRKELNLTQEKMASYLGTSVSGYRKWEQGQRQPSGAARNLLLVMAREPEAVLRALDAA
jgi:putative transcriptional regulator